MWKGRSRLALRLLLIGVGLDSVGATPPAPPASPLPAFPASGVWVVKGDNSGAAGCVTSASETSYDGVEIATQCCDGDTCRRYDPALGNPGGCFSGVYDDVSFVPRTFEEAQLKCALEGLTLCSISAATGYGSCVQQGCWYDSSASTS